MISRVFYIALAISTVTLGLFVHLGDTIFGAVRDPLGDALWAAMMTWWVSAALPRKPLRTRGLIALAISFAVEFSQLVRLPLLDSLRATLPGHLILGSGFDPRDLLAYAAGVAVATLVESAWLWRSQEN